MSDEDRGSSGSHPIVATGRNGPNVTLIGFGIVAVLFLVFFLQNSHAAEIEFLFFTKRTTIRWSIIVSVMLGVGLDRVFSVWWRRRGKRNTTDS